MDRTTKLMSFGAVSIWAVFAVPVGPKFFSGQSTGKAKNLVARDLKDPSSAHFRSVKAGKQAVCGEVNGKNSYGAYVGFKHFIVADGVAMIEPEPPASRLGPGVSLDVIEQWNANTGFRVEWSAKCPDPLPVLPDPMLPIIPK